MTINRVPLSEEDKKILNKSFKFRIILAVILIPLFTITLGDISYSVVTNSDGSAFSVMNIFGICIVITCIYLFFRFVVPFYKSTFKNIRAKNKLVVETRIIDIKLELVSNAGYRYLIQTEHPKSIDSFAAAVLIQKLNYSDMHVNMHIKIHFMEDNLTDILYFERV